LDALVRDLTDAQREAVLHREGPLLVLAGPGSGKTRVITHRIAWLLAEGLPDHQILALTFTNKAADEMRTRLERLAPGRSVWLGTFHRFCARLLRKYAPLVGLDENFTIYDAADSAQVLNRVLTPWKLGPGFATPEAIARAIGRAKNNLVTAQQYQPQAGHPLGALVQQIYPAYQAKLASSNAVDFDDLLLHVGTLLQENPEIRAALDERYRFILVDEYQDTNLAQYVIVRAMSIDHPNLAVTGDPDQSIYGWRGANLNNILEFEHDYPQVRVVRLERNYRSTQRILHVAAEFIAHNVRRKRKDLYTENAPGEPVRLMMYQTQNDEAQAIAAEIAGEIQAGRRAARDFAVFYRTNALSRAMEFALRQAGVPYQIVRGLEFFQRKEIKDLLSYLQLLCNPRDEVALRRVIQTPPRGIGRTTVDRLLRYAAGHGLSGWEAAREVRRIESIGSRPAARVAEFAGLLDRLAALAGGAIEKLLGHVLAESGYAALLKASEDEEDQERLANLQELLTVARDFDERHPGPDQLEAFLEETALVSDTDDWEDQTDRVTLMTLHASKGLEFPVVYLIAVEEGILPHERSRERPEQIEEERRLMFVGMTRARERLQLSLARSRDFRGSRRTTVPSSFLVELPRSEMLVEEARPEADSGPVPFSAYPEGLAEEDWDSPPPPAATSRRQSLIPNPQSPIPPASPNPKIPSKLRLGTADQLAGGQPAPPPSPDAFQQGMVVLHPQYGLGQVVALSGSGPGRQATVDFAPPAGRMQFVLQHSPLRPMASAQGDRPTIG
jgi:DNA helicase-2/ATP-dependent DNA helicase PcrA